MNIDDIKEHFWVRDVNNPDNILTEDDAVNQCIDLALFIREGELQGEVTKGSKLEEILDRPLQDAIPDLVKETKRVLKKHVTFIDVIKVKTVIEGSTIIVTIEYNFEGTLYKREISFE